MLGLIFFYTFALVVIGAAVGVITARNPVYSAFRESPEIPTRPRS